LAYESGNWEEVGERAAQLRMTEAQLPALYCDALSHASEVSLAIA